jgi:hypothetical protein
MHIQPTATDPDSCLLLQAIKGTHKKYVLYADARHTKTM